MSPPHSDLEPAGAHPSAERLLGYHRGRLGREDRKQLEGHLAECPECMRIVLDLTGRHRVPDRELDASWSAFRSRLETTDARREADSGRGLGQAEGRRSWLPRSAALAAALLAVAGLAGWGFVHQRQIRASEARVAELERLLASWSQPQTVVPGIDLLPGGALRQPGSTPMLEVPAEARLLVVRLTLLAPSVAEAFDLGIFGADGGLVFRLPGVRQNARGIVTLALPRDFLPEGTYRLRLYESGTESEPEAEFSLGLLYDEP